MNETLVYTVYGEHGNSTGPYTPPLPSMGAALGAIRHQEYSLCPLGSGGWEARGDRIVATVARPLAYTIVEHPPERQEGYEIIGGRHQATRVYRLADGSVSPHLDRPEASEWPVPAEWSDYCRRLAALPARSNWIRAYEEVLVK